MKDLKEVVEILKANGLEYELDTTILSDSTLIAVKRPKLPNGLDDMSKAKVIRSLSRRKCVVDIQQSKDCTTWIIRVHASIGDASGIVYSKGNWKIVQGKNMAYVTDGVRVEYPIIYPDLYVLWTCDDIPPSIANKFKDLAALKLIH